MEQKIDSSFRRRVLVMLASCALATIVAHASAATGPQARLNDGSALPERFDAARDAAADLASAVALARRTQRRVIVDVGGEWCTWCHIMDRFFAGHPDLTALRDRHYVWLKVNYSKENPNRVLLERWPKVAGYPHLFVLDARGELVHSQDTSVLESGQSYSEDAIRRFLLRFATPTAS
ncbi:MAG: thioredoxin family protein [Pseudomonadota bacterium]|nr:thioredoxin family protein [Pseudomonadota bacterium]